MYDYLYLIILKDAPTFYTQAVNYIHIKENMKDEKMNWRIENLDWLKIC